MNMFMVYIANVSDNIHSFASISLFIGFFMLLWSWMPVSISEGGSIFEKYIKPNTKYVGIGLGVLFLLYLLTPSNWKLDMDSHYIQENTQLRAQLNDITLQLSQCEMKRGCYRNGNN